MPGEPGVVRAWGRARAAAAGAAVAVAQAAALAELHAPEVAYQPRAAPARRRGAVIGSAPQLNAQGLLEQVALNKQREDAQRAQARLRAWRGVCACSCVLPGNAPHRPGLPLAALLQACRSRQLAWQAAGRGHEPSVRRRVALGRWTGGQGGLEEGARCGPRARRARTQRGASASSGAGCPGACGRRARTGRRRAGRHPQLGALGRAAAPATAVRCPGSALVAWERRACEVLNMSAQSLDYVRMFFKQCVQAYQRMQ